LNNVAFTLIGGYAWFGGYNYQVNLIKALLNYQHTRVNTFLFLGEDTDKRIVDRFKEINGLHIIQSPIFDEKLKSSRLFKAIFFGKDSQALNIFSSYQIDVVFEVANFYGWRFPIPSIAWIPDLQHRQMKHLFSFFGYWKRELGFQFQLRSGRKMMFSSEDAKTTFERFYPESIGKTHVGRFAIPTQECHEDIVKIRDTYKVPHQFFFLPNQFWKHKNHECVIRALAIAKEQGHEIVVVSTGQKSDIRDALYFPKIESLVKELGLVDNFIMLGVIPYQHIIGLMQSCDALINPSLFEGWSTTVEEAKALGVKMILSDIPVHREQAVDSTDFFDPNDSNTLAQLLINFQFSSDNEKKVRLEQAKINSNFKVAAFANTFANIVETCSQK
jgi:glycosyltransferase involved in cell wall biosynthesis